ncbi:MAG: DUF1178 family protein, partial [Alphaproteobacteria bacterium]|nr:DUF1178 family protein [Alphaproteobacteria bacterium]
QSWFQSAGAFDTLAGAGMVSCPDCGSAEIGKSLMAPRVRAARDAAAENPLTAPEEKSDTPLAKLRAHVEQNADYVGLGFATEARAMHDGDQPERAIYGEAKPEDAKKLIEDGIPVAPLPFTPRAKQN